MFLFDQNDKLFIETTNSGFAFHKNYMGQNNITLAIEDNSNHEVGTIIKNLNRNGDCFGDENWGDCDNDRQRIQLSSDQINQYLENNVMVTV